MDSPSPRFPQMLPRGIACIATGLAVLLAPMVLQAQADREMISGAYRVGWFAMALGMALMTAEGVQRAKYKAGASGSPRR